MNITGKQFYQLFWLPLSTWKKGFIFHQTCEFLWSWSGRTLRHTCNTKWLQSVQTDRGEFSIFSFSPVLAEIMLHLLPVFLGSVVYLSLAGGRLSDGQLTGGRLSMVVVILLKLLKGVSSSLLTICGLLAPDPGHLAVIKRLFPAICYGL